MVAVSISLQSFVAHCGGLRLACRSGGNKDSICKLNSQKWVLAPGRQCLDQSEHVWASERDNGDNRQAGAQALELEMSGTHASFP